MAVYGIRALGDPYGEVAEICPRARRDLDLCRQPRAQRIVATAPRLDPGPQRIRGHLHRGGRVSETEQTVKEGYRPRLRLPGGALEGEGRLLLGRDPSIGA